MFRALITWITVLLIGGAALVTVPMPSPAETPANSAAQPSPKNSTSHDYDEEAERQLLEMTNEARAKTGVPGLAMDSGLAQAARQHSSIMAAEQQLSHQFPWEPSLTERLAETSGVHLDHEGENVAYAPSVVQSENGLMGSPEHRENILNPAFNIAGFGVVRRGSTLYVTEDFGHGLPIYSSRQAEHIVEQNVAQMRRGFILPQLHWADNALAQNAACAMAKADSINAGSPYGRYVLRYTTMQPETLPASAAKAVQDPAVRGLGLGTCYARTTTYPNGAYWVTLIFY